MPDRVFLISWIFCYFFRNFLPRVEYERNSSLNFFLSFSANLIPFWQKIIPERGFLNFLNLFAICFWNFLARVESERNSGLNFFFLFLGLSYPILDKNNAGKGFFNFLNFFAIFFFEFSCPGWVWTKFGTKIFFSLSRPILSRFG